jgi:hypothetical protein
MVLNVIAGYLLVGTPVVHRAQIIRGVSRALLVLVNEGTAPAQRRTPRRRVRKAPSRLMCEGLFSKLAEMVTGVARMGSSWATRNASSVPRAAAWARRPVDASAHQATQAPVQPSARC